jgi:hypothetical protein
LDTHFIVVLDPGYETDQPRSAGSQGARFDRRVGSDGAGSNRFWGADTVGFPCGKVVFVYEFFTSSRDAQILRQWVQRVNTKTRK